MRNILCLFAACALLAGCSQPAALPPAPAFTNSIEGEINARILVAEYAYAAGKFAQLHADDRAKFGEDIMTVTDRFDLAFITNEIAENVLRQHKSAPDHSEK